MADIIYVDLDYVATGYTVSTLDGAVAIVTVISMDGPPNSGWALDGYWEVGYTSSGPVGELVTIKEGAADLSSIDTFTVDATANRNFTGDLACTFTASASGNYTADPGLTPNIITWDDQDYSWDSWTGSTWDEPTGILINSRSSLTGLAESSVLAFAGMQSVISVLATAERVVVADAVLTSTVSVAATGIRIQEGAVSLSSATDINITSTRTREASASVACAITLTATGLVTKEGAAALVCTGSFTSTARLSADGSAALQAFDTVSVIGKAQLTSEIDLTSTAMLSASASSLLIGARDLVSTITLTATPRGDASGEAALATTSAFTATAARILGASADLSSVFTTYNNGGMLKGGIANLQAFDFVLATGFIVHIEACRTFTVPEENRRFQVDPKQSLVVYFEDRVNMVSPGLESIAVPEEDRVIEAFC